MAQRRGKGRSPHLKRPLEIRDLWKPDPEAEDLPDRPAAAPEELRADEAVPPEPAPSVEQATPTEPAILITDADVHHAPPPCDGDVAQRGPRKARRLRLGAGRHRDVTARVLDNDALPVPEAGGWYWIAAGLLTVCLTVWLFGQTLGQLVTTWKTEPDYSHGFLVVPFALLTLWLRRGSLPSSNRPGWGGLILIAAGFGLRFTSERLFLTPLAGWAVIVWLAGACWLLAGRRMFIWAIPAITFLAFMIPLPLRIDQLLSEPLQTATTRLSTFLFTCLCLPAIPEGHTVYLGEHVLDIEQVCSGLRMFMGIGAVAFAFVMLQRRSPPERTILIFAVAPVALLSNAIRVVVTGLLMQRGAGEAAARFSHNSAGWMMIAVAAVLFGLLAAWLRRLIVPVTVESGQRLLKRPATI